MEPVFRRNTMRYRIVRIISCSLRTRIHWRAGQRHSRRGLFQRFRRVPAPDRGRQRGVVPEQLEGTRLLAGLHEAGVGNAGEPRADGQMHEALSGRLRGLRSEIRLVFRAGEPFVGEQSERQGRFNSSMVITWTPSTSPNGIRHELTGM